MKWHRIYGVILRYTYLLKRSYDRLSDIFYWPTVDILLWGLTSSYLQSVSPDVPSIIAMLLSGLLLWQFVWRAQYEISVGLLEDLWNKNLINMFVSPLRFSEWISGMMIMGIVKAIISFGFASLLAFLLYAMNVYRLGFALLPFAGLLIMTGWWIGFLVAGIVMRYGTKIQTLAWSMAYIFSPFSAIYYPVSILPQWAQYIASAIPTSYIFEGARQVIQTGTINWNYIGISFVLNCVYLVLTFIWLRTNFKVVLNRGLVNLH